MHYFCGLGYLLMVQRNVLGFAYCSVDGKDFSFICFSPAVPSATLPQIEMALFTVNVSAEGPCQQHGGETRDWGVVVSGSHSEH